MRQLIKKPLQPNKCLRPRAERAGDITSQNISHLPNLEVGLLKQFSLPPLPSPSLSLLFLCVYMEHVCLCIVSIVCLCRCYLSLSPRIDMVCFYSVLMYVQACDIYVSAGYAHVYVEVKGHQRILSSPFCLILKAVSPGFVAVYTRLAYERFSCLGLPLSTGTGVTDVHYCIWAFTWLPEIKLRPLGVSPMKPSPQLPN